MELRGKHIGGSTRSYLRMAAVLSTPTLASCCSDTNIRLSSRWAVYVWLVFCACLMLQRCRLFPALGCTCMRHVFGIHQTHAHAVCASRTHARTNINVAQELEDHGIHIERCTVYKKLNLLESIYIHLLGNDFRYRMGTQVSFLLPIPSPRSLHSTPPWGYPLLFSLPLASCPRDRAIPSSPSALLALAHFCWTPGMRYQSSEPRAGLRLFCLFHCSLSSFQS